MKRLVARVVTAWCLISPAFLLAGTIRHDRDDALYTSLAADPRYASVGIVRGDGVGSGTLVASDWVLTAAHVGSTSMSFEVGGVVYPATSWVPHPSAWAGGSGFAYDIGLMKLGSAVDVIPAQLYQGSNEVGSEVTFVGYGKTGDGLTGANKSAYTKRAGTNVVDQLGTYLSRKAGVNVLMSDFDHPDGSTTRMGSATPLDLEYMIAPGDSGGPVFINEGGNTYLAGVHSQMDGGGLYDSYSLHIRVSTLHDWITGVVNGSSDGGGGGGGKGGGKGGGGKGNTSFSALATSYAQPIPEPNSVLLVLTLIACYSCSRSLLGKNSGN